MSRRAYDRVKRSIDILAAATGLVLLSPILGIIAVALRLTMGPPVLFRQRRPGLDGRPFTLYKFRTMRPPEPGAAPVETDEERISRLGWLLRRTSLDELPELYNVLVGDMSLVGPRPLLMEYLPLYSPAQARRHEVRPGITGWAQVNGRNAIGWEEKFRLDIWYVDHRSLGLDLKILALTIRSVLSGRGVNQEGRTTVDRFRGTNGGVGRDTA